MPTVLSAATVKRRSTPSGAGKDALSIHEKLACGTLTLGLTAGLATEWLNRSWVLHIVQLAILVATLAIVAKQVLSGKAYRWPASVYVIYLASLLGIIQLSIGSTVYLQATLLSSFNWATIACLACIGSSLLSKRMRRIFFLETLLAVGSVATLMELYQLFILGRFNVMAAGLPLLSSNYYAELIELLIPVSLYLAHRRLPNPWIGNCIAAAMASTVIASGARMGSAIVLCELLVCFALIWREIGTKRLKLLRPIAITVGLSAALVLVEGAGVLKSRLLEPHPLQHRKEFMLSAVQMVKQRPLEGFGLGSFSVVYPEFQRYDSTYLINHVHDDYMEITTEGGVVLLLIWLIFLTLSLRAGIGDMWRLGCLGLLVHSFTDFPLYRPYVAAFLVILLAEIPKDLLKASHSSVFQSYQGRMRNNTI